MMPNITMREQIELGLWLAVNISIFSSANRTMSKPRQQGSLTDDASELSSGNGFSFLVKANCDFRLVSASLLILCKMSSHFIDLYIHACQYLCFSGKNTTKTLIVCYIIAWIDRTIAITDAPLFGGVRDSPGENIFLSPVSKWIMFGEYTSLSKQDLW